MIKPKLFVDKSGTRVYYLPAEIGMAYDVYDRTQIVKGILHREDGPAVIKANGHKVWYINGKLHREDGPAIKWRDKSKWWYLNGELHRENGPAIEDVGGEREWYVNGKLHREDGPAMEWPDGHKEWYINGKELSYEEWFEWVMTHSSKDNQMEVLLKMN